MAPANASPYGINAHVARDEMLERIAEAGIGWLRIDVDWSEIEPVQGYRDWAEVDRILATASRLGLSVLANLAYAPPWATLDNKRTGAPRQPGVWQDFVAEFITRHRVDVAAVSIGNEPNLTQFFTGQPGEYLSAIAQPGLAAARQVAPELLRCGPDLSSSGNPLKRLATILDALGDLLDVITHHQYDGHDSVAGRVKELDALNGFLEKRRDRRPIWITETGWDRPRFTEDVNSASLRGMLREMRKRTWWEKTFWYDSHGPEWGLLEPDASPRRGEPRPAFLAYSEEIVGAQPSGPGLDAAAARVVVTRAYLAILGREPEISGLEAYAHDLEHGHAILRLCQVLFESDEFRSQRAYLSPEILTDALYAGILDRPPDSNGRAETLAAVKAGRLAQRAAEMLESREFADQPPGKTPRLV